MHLPSIVIHSQDDQLCRQLLAELSGQSNLRMARQLELIEPIVREESSRIVIFDARHARDGGHAIDRAIENLQLELTEIQEIMLITPEIAPEMLERRAVCSGLNLLRGNVSAAHLALMIRKSLQKSQEDTEAEFNVPFEVEPRDQYGEAVYTGASRKFETRSPQLKKMLDDLFIAASHDVTILLIGETGSGKTFLSSLIHEISPRRQQPFLHVPCGALPRELIESELFGHVKGAFTSAHADKEGKFLAAGRGTILLDEIDVLGLEQQVKLLRVIETGEFEAVGSNATQRSQARLVVASNLDLQPLVQQNRFRPDLYYRLSMLKFEILPLRKRKMDVIPLAKKFVQRFQEKHKMIVSRIEEPVLNALLNYPWPGNVRELEHVMQRAVIYCRDGILTTDHLPSHVLAGHAGPTNDPSVVLGKSPQMSDNSLEQQVALSEKEIIEQALFKNNFSRTRTARDLGISRVTLYNKMKKYEMLK